jgi:ferredoxin
MLYIDPDECIECGACVPKCPVEAIFLDRHIPSLQLYWVAENRRRAPLLPVIARRQCQLPGATARACALGFPPATDDVPSPE